MVVGPTGIEGRPGVPRSCHTQTIHVDSSDGESKPASDKGARRSAPIIQVEKTGVARSEVGPQRWKKMEENHDRFSAFTLRANPIPTFAYLCLCLNSIFFYYLAFSDPCCFLYSAREDSWIENLTSVWLFLGSIFLFATVRMEQRSFQRWLYISGGIALFYATGEEISWGHRIFNYPMPDFWTDINTQNETNLHNIRILHKIHTLVRVDGMRLMVLMTILAFFGKKDAFFGIPLPSILLILGFLVANFSQVPFNEDNPIDSIGVLSLWIRLLLTPDKIGILLLFLFALIFKNHKLLIICVTSGFFVTTIFIGQLIRKGTRLEEWDEYLLALFLFLYSLELFWIQVSTSHKRIPRLGQRSATDNEVVSSIHRWLSTDIRQRVSNFLHIYQMTNFARTSHFIILFLVIVSGIALLYSANYYAQLHTANFQNIYQAVVARKPWAHSHFDVHLHNRTLVYVREPCALPDRKPGFFLNVYPFDDAALPLRRRAYNFDDLVFKFPSCGMSFDNKCIVVVPLPGYDIRRIVSGQYTDEGRLWEVDLPFRE